MSIQELCSLQAFRDNLFGGRNLEVRLRDMSDCHRNQLESYRRLQFDENLLRPHWEVWID